MYNVNLKDIVPSGDLTCLFAKNRVLVTKPHNKTPYELLHGRTPSIGFMRPFGCLVTILNTIDTLGKFEGKVNEGFLVGYSVNSKAFSIFNSRTHIIQETLHIKQGRKLIYNMCFFLYESTSSSNPQNREGDAAFDEKEHDAEKPESAVNLSLSRSALLREKDDMIKKKEKGKVPTAGKNYSNNANPINAAGPIVPAAGYNYSNSTNPINVASPSNSNSSPTHGQSLLRDTYQPPDIVEREDIVNSDHENVGAEADFNNLETSITVSPIPTTRTHNAHPISQIIGNMSSTTQTRSMTRVIKDQ
nr:retrovirus-related Pol polyprotein from transposon TNT 1-94 [Tanacetum cinerariifolium]